jgi:aminoglycoside phosphotransferase (APT) family kinase protein
VGGSHAESGPDGVAVDAVSRWFTEHVDDAAAPFSFELLAGGRSNLTFSVSDSAGRRWVLRRPPVGELLATAHDVGREYAIIRALSAEGSVPVPTPLGLCDDEDVNGAPFLVMEFVDGLVPSDPAAAEQLAPPARRRASERLVDVLVTLHELDVDAVGLGDLGRHEGYIERQIRRWHSQYEKAAERSGEREPLLDELHRLLAARIPSQQGVAVVHGDYRLENVIVDDDGDVRAVLDWELTTLGDPLADLGLLLVYWSNPGGDDGGAFPSANSVEGFPAGQALAARYAGQSSRDLADLDFYTAFGFWKLACIAHGIAARFKGGTMGGDRENLDEISRQVAVLARRAHARLVPV